MKVLGIVCSPRLHGNTEILVQTALAKAQKQGAEVELVTLAGKTISPCDACYSCFKTGKCHIEDDMQTIYEAMERADGIIIGSPIYFWSICGQAKVMIDRTFALRFPSLHLTNKIGGIILVASRRGCINASGLLNNWMISNHMIPLDVVDGYARLKGAITKDLHAMKAAFELGRLMAKMAGKGFKYPEDFPHPLYQLVQVNHGIDVCPIP